MRYLTMIFYLNNDGWVEEHGGVTGIYTTPAFGSLHPAVLVPPKNNSLLLFECTPHSWHTFMTTSRRRNSITLWLHRSMESSRKQWPNHEPVYWS
ncbi:2OG-Fe(II) oxygenase [Methylobacterium oryzae]|uniref:2OG-Fe(II) oxygenase n=1 Tax=Methylobacterium oryzae TaxID=334852 RepID=UPI003AF2D7CD